MEFPLQDVIVTIFYIKKITFSFLSSNSDIAVLMVDALPFSVYDESASGRPGESRLRVSVIEESPHSTGHGAEEIPERRNLLDGPQKKTTPSCLPQIQKIWGRKGWGNGEKVV